MGYLLIDHSQGAGPPGPDGVIRSGIKVEFDTVNCSHCQAVIKVLNAALAGAKDYETPYRCNKCGSRPICRHCAEQMNENGGKCENFRAKIDHALATRGWDEHYQHAYNVIPTH